MKTILQSLPEFRAMAAYLAEPAGRRALGAVAALQQAARELLQGRFGAAGTLGMRATLRRRNGKAAFVCGDPLRFGQTGSVFAALLDLCLMEILSRAGNEGNAYLLIDDAGALPRLDHLESALRCGGAKGLKIVLSLSDAQTLYARYGETAARSVLGMFGAVAAFRMRERVGREFVRDLYGRRRAAEAPAQQGPAHPPSGRPESARMIEDEDLTTLAAGECVFCTRFNPPFYFRTKPYGGKT
jgi:type IV secretory pathway TraG/TraD family ATPase VirD4